MGVPAVAQAATIDVFVQSGVVSCPGGNLTGYITIEAMNKDMEEELDNIRGGSPPREPYFFLLCPRTTFDLTSVALTPLLSGSVFSCGTMGDPTLGCKFDGGNNQVLIENPVNVTDYKLQLISFVGVTFTGFTNAAFSGNAGSATTLDIYNSSFAVSARV